jgi:Cdc6-like AAA superfamily ATPase
MPTEDDADTQRAVRLLRAAAERALEEWTTTGDDAYARRAIEATREAAALEHD